MRCRDKAQQWVNMAAAGSVPLTLVPVPGFTTPSLTALEAALVYQVAKIYGVSLSQTDLTVLAGSLGVGAVAIKTGLMELLTFVPVAGWVVKTGVAFTTVRTLGAMAIRYFEDRYPDKEFTLLPPPSAKDIIEIGKGAVDPPKLDRP